MLCALPTQIPPVFLTDLHHEKALRLPIIWTTSALADELSEDNFPRKVRERWLLHSHRQSIFHPGSSVPLAEGVPAADLLSPSPCAMPEVPPALVAGKDQREALLPYTTGPHYKSIWDKWHIPGKNRRPSSP